MARPFAMTFMISDQSLPSTSFVTRASSVVIVTVMVESWAISVKIAKTIVSEAV